MGGRTKGTRVGNGVGQGDGWGGPAKGAAQDRKPIAEPFEPGNDLGGKPSEKTADRTARTAALENQLYDLAFGAEREETRVTAAVKLHAIYNGQPVARNVNATVDDVSQLSDDAIRAELERAGGAPASAGAGDAAAGVPAGSDGVRH